MGRGSRRGRRPRPARPVFFFFFFWFVCMFSLRGLQFRSLGLLLSVGRRVDVFRGSRPRVGTPRRGRRGSRESGVEGLGTPPRGSRPGVGSPADPGTPRAAGGRESRGNKKKKRKKKRKKKGKSGCSTGTSREVTHPSTIPAQRRLTSEF